MSEAFLDVQALVKYFPIKSDFIARITRSDSKAFVHAVDNVTFSVGRGETFGVVGESGSGKTTLGLLILGLIKPTSGSIFFEGSNLAELPEVKAKKVKNRMQVVFQDPSSSLDPRNKVVDSIAEPLKAQGNKDKAEIRAKVSEALRVVGLDQSQMEYFPHQFSGGQRQRICIARAIVQSPELIVLDEPTSSLDASVQSQILLLLQKLQEELKLSYLLITHNMSVARYMTDRIAVMYVGKIVEIGTTREIVENPMHPYTRLLISSVLEPSENTKLPPVNVSGEMPSQISPPKGCRFNTRCAFARQRCFEEEPDLRSLSQTQHVACFFAEEIQSSRTNK